MSLLDLFRRAQTDDASPQLEADVTVDPPALGRRERITDAGSDFVIEALGGKLLHSWLQNRHQTLMPLSLNMALMSPRQRQGLARILASMLLAGRPAADASEAAPGLRAWLAGLGADDAVLIDFDQALETPLPLNVMFETALADELMIYAYVATMMASDTRFPVSVMLCDMVQARFNLPPALVRSAIRRFRR